LIDRGKLAGCTFLKAKVVWLVIVGGRRCERKQREEQNDRGEDQRGSSQHDCTNSLFQKTPMGERPCVILPAEWKCYVSDLAVVFSRRWFALPIGSP
jgi:hypothetical protein